MKNSTFTAVMLGDIIGKPGRKAVAKKIPDIIRETQADFVVANGENASGGLGLTTTIATELLDLPIQVLTSGNHIWKHKELQRTMEHNERLVRPANYPPNTPGRGWTVVSSQAGINVAVLNLQGVLFMSHVPCPFRTADAELRTIRRQTNIILVDFHAEATSEKRAMGHYLAGRVSAMVGTHTHIPTADAEILEGGTGYLTDLGMCGPTDSVIGVRKEPAIQRFVTKLPSPFQVAQGGLRIQGAVIQIDAQTGKCQGIQQRAWEVSHT